MSLEPFLILSYDKYRSQEAFRIAQIADFVENNYSVKHAK